MIKPQKSQTIVKEDIVALNIDECLAKTYRSINNDMLPGRTVLSHCHIVALVARQMIMRMPKWLHSALFPEGSEYVAGAHDVGKISPTFQEKIYRGTTGYVLNSKPGLENINPELEKQWGGHAGVSYATTKALEVGRFIPDIVGQHHGYSPNLGGRLAQHAIFGSKPWQNQRELLLNKLQNLLSIPWPVIANETQAKVVSGLTTVADWIGSSSWFEDPNQSWDVSTITSALDNAGFIAPEFKQNLSFKEIFSFSPHESQSKFFEQVVGPGIYIFEAPMGLGKTEAALHASYLLMSSGMATGLYFALPTQLTSDKIHERVVKFLKHILLKEKQHHALLLHGNSWIKKTEMGEEGGPGGSWFDTKKRGILAPFAVGTIDQALMAVMNVKYGFVRTFGLAGKVVILDELHTYDAYTGTIVDKLIKELQAIHCTVIILSATLTSARRQDLLGFVPKNHQYPLISILNQEFKELSTLPLENKEIKLHLTEFDEEAIQQVLKCASDGQQVLWIENTVDEAQRFFNKISARACEMNITCGLLHSRFLKIDREEHEVYWIMLFGKEGNEHRKTGGHILIGTQVLEQSIDIDADFMVSRFCPTDMLFQRLGRLWRHKNTYRPNSALCEAWILAPSLDKVSLFAKSVFKDTAKVYSPYVLCRSLEVWASLTSIVLPRDIRPMLEATYKDRDEKSAMQQYKTELENNRVKLAKLACIGLSTGGKTLPESKASTRHSEIESVEVLLLKAFYFKADGTDITLLNNDKLFLPRNLRKQSKQQWREKAIVLAQNTIRVPIHKAPLAIAMSQLRPWLGDYFFLGNPTYLAEEQESFLRLALVNEDGSLIGINFSLSSQDYLLTYDKVIGYRAIKNN